MRFISLGSDPEFFVLDPKGKPFPATLFAKGTKEFPVPIAELGDGFFEQRDNLSFEGNVPPAYTKEDFVKNLSLLRKFFLNKVALFGYSLSNNGVEYFSKRYLDTAEGLEFGCSSTISSWDSSNKEIISRPTPILDGVNFRVSGFHIHIGYDEPLFKNKLQTDILIGRLFDLFVTVPSHDIKPEPERIKTYGKWGMIRSKSYGVECRTLSTFFTRHDWLDWVWDQVMKIEEFINLSNEEDINLLTKSSHILGTDKKDINNIFIGIFSHFKNLEILTKFNETNEIYKEIIANTNNNSTTTNPI